MYVGLFISPSSVFSPGEEFPIQKSASLSGLIPRAPAGSDWMRSRAKKGSESDIVDLHDMLEDLDKQAGLVVKLNCSDGTSQVEIKYYSYTLPLLAHPSSNAYYLQDSKLDKARTYGKLLTVLQTFCVSLRFHTVL